MKDQLLDRPPTIGDYRRQGVVAIEVRCQRPCKRIGRLPLDALRLPDDTPLQRITTLRRLRCSNCDRLLAETTPIYPRQEAPPIGEQRPAQWIVTRIEDGRELTSSPLWSRTEALQFARRAIAVGRTVARIEGPAKTIEADAVAAWRPGEV